MFFALCAVMCSAQVSKDSISEAEKEYLRNYNERIKLTRIDGVYIPADLDDAFRELEVLSDPNGLTKFKQAPEELVAERLQGGLGRWMILNWGFYEGSRLSHYLKELGIHHPEDMSRFLLVSFHRHLNEQSLLVDQQVEHYQAMRKAAYEARIERDTFKID